MSAASHPQLSNELVDHLFRNRAGQMVAYLTRVLGAEHLDIAEEAVQEALLKALQTWPYNGVPDNPAGWLFRVARNAALDVLRHRKLVSQKTAEFVATAEMGSSAGSSGDSDFEEKLRDDELRMVLMCCHPVLSQDARVALSLKTVGGFSAREIAKAFLSEETAIAQRLVRAKRQMREEGIGLELPSGKELAQRLDSALEVVYLMFNEGYAAQSGPELFRKDLCDEALRLAQLLADSSVGTPQAHALVALLAFQAARLPARVDSQGEMVLLEEQDRGLWDQALLALGFRHFGLSAEGEEISPYHLQAAIAAIHASASSEADTDWEHMLQLYDELMEVGPSPVVALNRAVVVVKVKGIADGLAELRSLAEEKSLRNYYLLPAAEASLLLQMGERDEAARLFREALKRPCSEPEKRLLVRRWAECEAIAPCFY
ncbi:MAG TPA: sigma-70 family RNA polymerase sigma factor [Candidatus Acidoferrum sp.]|nr:sigma-70 family RNA polymerase sigma factor [Candidatus Acidoferrum sp.]